MSSWKTYGGKNNAENSGKIAAESITTNKLVLQRPYDGVFEIDGGLTVSGNTDTDNLIVSSRTFLNGNSIIGINPDQSLTVNTTTTFVGPVIFKGDSETTGNIVSLESLIAHKNVYLGNVIYFGNSALPPIQSIYYDVSGIGINQPVPNAAFDISSNQPYSISVISSNRTNESIIAQNCSGQSITMGVDLSSAHIRFFYDSSFNMGNAVPADAVIEYNKNGLLTIDVSNNVNIASQMTIAPYTTTAHINGETVTIYDISSGPYYPSIYGNTRTNTGSALTMVATDLSSNTFINITTPAGKGLAVGGGAYARDASRATGILTLNGNLNSSVNPAQMIVSGNSTVKYFSTTGINTFQPRTDEYVLDVNGPIHVDNGDIAEVLQTPFQIYQLSMAKNYRNIAIGIGSSIDVSNNVATYFREKIVKTTDYGQTWSNIDLSYTFLNSSNYFTSVHLVDNSSCFITGNVNTMIYSGDGGNNWRSIIGLTTTSSALNHVFINPVPKTSGNLCGYYCFDTSSTLLTFEYDASNVRLNSNNNINGIIPNTKQYINQINYIQANSSAIYLAGNAIVKYNATPNSTLTDISYASSHVYAGYTYNQLKIFDNSYVIAVGNNVISSTTNGGITWTDVSFNRVGNNKGVHFRSVHMADASNAIAVGWYGNIWISSNQGSSWSPIPSTLINASGKSALLKSGMFDEVVMPTINTVLLVNTIQPYMIDLSQNGISNIYNVFIPNWLNRANNIVMDISGTVNVSGDLKISDGGSLVSANPSMNVFNNAVRSIQFGGDATQITIGNVINSGNTTFRTNVLMNHNVSLTAGNSILSVAGIMNLAGNAYIGGNVAINGGVAVTGNVLLYGNMEVNGQSAFNSQVNVINSDVVLNTGRFIAGNVFPIGQALTLGGADNDIYVGGVANNNRQNTIYIGQSGGGGGSSTNYSTIVIGGANDQVILQGNTTIMNIQQSAVQSKTTMVNVAVVGAGANVTSGGAGIDIFDNSYVPLANNSHVYGYMHVGQDMQSFVFKAPSYGAKDNYGNDAANTYGNTYLISPENRVRLGVNQMTLSGLPNVKRGLVVLQSDSDFKGYQSIIGNSFNPYPSNPDADYAINLCPDFDISNILLKNFDTIVGSQTIGSNLAIGNISAPASLSIYGNTNTYGVINSYGNTFFSNMTFPNGNLFVPYGNVGIGTIVPQYPLDISGTARVLGPLISTNYDGVRFASNYGNVWADTRNIASAGSHFQDVAMSYDGKYQYGVLYNKSGVGSVNVSSNYGSSWSSVALPASNSGRNIYQAVPYLTANTQTFQFSDLQLVIREPNAQPINVQIGKYVASSSTNTTASNAFNGVITNAWQTASTTAYDYTGSYVGGVYFTNSIAGEWVQIKLPYSFIITSYKIYNSLDGFGTTTGPKDMYLFGSNDGNTWIQISSNTLSVGVDQTVIINNEISYSSYRFVINKIFSATSSAATIAKLNLAGFVQNTSGAFSYTIAASGTGKSVLVANQGYISGNGNLYISNNYGASFNDTLQKAVNGVWQGVAVSQTGIFQAAIGINRSGSSNIWISTNSGVSWASSIGVPNGWQSIAMNSTGQYISAIQSGNISAPAGNIWVSSTYGSSWSSYGNIYQYTTSVNAFANESSADFNKTIHISTNGKYQTALGLAPSSDVLYGNANIWTNSNYGQGPWQDTGVSTPIISGNVSILSSISMTGGGQHQIASYIADSVGGNSVSGGLLKSVDYGKSWTADGFVPPAVSSGGNVYRGFFPKIETSANGQYLVGVAKYQDISGNTYNNNNSTAVGIGNIFSSSVTVTNNLFQAKYMGSSYLGNVNQTHGLTVSVPHVNNAAIMMGYDTAWDSAYINASNEYSQNALCLNVNGGTVGIGKIAPNTGAYAIDVSGNMNIDGGLTIGGATNFASAASFTSLIVNSNSYNYSTVTVSDSTNAGANKMNLVGSLTTVTKNPIAQNSDVGVIYTASGAGGIVIAPVNMTASGMRISSSGNVGIGTSMIDSSYAYPLQIQGPSGTLLKLVNNTTGYVGGQSNIEFWDNSSNYNLAKISAIDLLTTTGNARSALAMSVGYNSNVVEGMRLVGNINANGGTTAFVGIGTTDPIYALDISGGDMRVVSSENTSIGTIRLGSSSAYIQSRYTDMVVLNQRSGNLLLGTNNANIVAISSGGASILGNAIISGNSTIGSLASSNSSTSGALQVKGGAGIGENMNVGGNVVIWGSKESLSASSGAFQVSGGAGIGGNIFAAGNVVILSNVESSTYSSGALKVSGGVGISGNIYSRGNLYTGGYITVGGGDSTIASKFLSATDSQPNYNQIDFNFISDNASLVVNGGISIGKSATVLGNLYVGATRGIGTSIFNSSNSASSSTSAAVSLKQGGLYVYKNIIVDSTSDVDLGTKSNTALFIRQGGLYVEKSIYSLGNITTVSTSQPNTIGLVKITGNNITAGSATFNVTNDTVPLTLVGTSGQNANLFDVKTTSTNSVFTVNKNGVATFSNLTDATSTSGALVVNGGISAGKDIYIGGKITAGSSSSIGGVTLNAGSITTAGSISGVTTLSASGVATFSNGANPTATSTDAAVKITNSGGLYVSGTIRAVGKIIAATTTDTINGIIISNKNVSEVENLSALKATFSDTTNATSTTSGALVVSGGISAAKDIYIVGKITAGSSSSIGGVTLNAGAITAAGSITGVTTLSASGVATFSNGANPTATSTDAAVKITNSGGLYVSGSIRIDGSIITSSDIPITSLNANSTTAVSRIEYGLSVGPATTTDAATSGQIVASGRITGASFNASSDYRMKRNIVPLTDISCNVDGLVPVKYEFIESNQEDMGFIAHEVQNIFPFLVTGEKDGVGMQSMNYNGFIALLVKEVQDLKKENAALKSQLGSISDRLSRLESGK